MVKGGDRRRLNLRRCDDHCSCGGERIETRRSFAPYDAANRLTNWNGATYDDNGTLLSDGVVPRTGRYTIG